MKRRHMHLRPTLVAAALLVPLICARTSAARGTGGFLREWAVCGPLEGTNLQAPDLGTDFAAWPGLLTLNRVWTPVQADADGKVDLRLLWPEPPTGVALLHTFFFAPSDGPYVLRIGSDDAAQIEIDGRSVYSRDVNRPWRADTDEVPVAISRGWHRMLVRVAEYGGAWAVSVRLANPSGRPLEIRHQAEVPEPLQAAYGFSDSVTLGERAAAAHWLLREADRVVADLHARRERQESLSPGYVTFAAYSGARASGIEFFDAMARLWESRVTGEPDEADAQAAANEALVGAGGLSDALAAETQDVLDRLPAMEKAWERLGGRRLARGQLADALADAARLLLQVRLLADRTEKEHVLMARFENDIRNWRQGNLQVRVLKAEGGVAEGAEVEIVQASHRFLFGCNVFAFGRWGNERRNRLYEQRFLRLFNLATVPTYWSALEERRDRPQLESLDRMLRWAREHGLSVEAYPLLWQETMPPWVADLSPAEARAAVESHVRRLVEQCGDRVDWWNLVCPTYGVFRPGPTRVTSSEVGHWTTQTRAGAGLVFTYPEPRYASQIAEHFAATRTPTAVGVLAQQYEGTWPVDLVQRTLDKAGAAEAPIHVVAVTILGGPEEEAEQAEAVRRFYTAAFAHPCVAAVSWWDLSDRFASQNAPGGLVRSDLSPKPAYEVLDRLINRLWRTDAAGRSDAKGCVVVRAFYGRYRITARTDGRSASVQVDFGPDGPRTVEVVLPPEGNAAQPEASFSGATRSS